MAQITNDVDGDLDLGQDPEMLYLGHLVQLWLWLELL